ncbi:hypothetical protein BU16DRAFT_596543, partial [Lophium mytilinum]
RIITTKAHDGAGLHDPTQATRRGFFADKLPHKHTPATMELENNGTNAFRRTPKRGRGGRDPPGFLAQTQAQEARHRRAEIRSLLAPQIEQQQRREERRIQPPVWPTRESYNDVANKEPRAQEEIDEDDSPDFLAQILEYEAKHGRQGIPGLQPRPPQQRQAIYHRPHYEMDGREPTPPHTPTLGWPLHNHGFGGEVRHNVEGAYADRAAQSEPEVYRPLPPAPRHNPGAQARQNAYTPYAGRAVRPELLVNWRRPAQNRGGFGVGNNVERLRGAPAGLVGEGMDRNPQVVRPLLAPPGPKILPDHVETPREDQANRRWPVRANARPDGARPYRGRGIQARAQNTRNQERPTNVDQAASIAPQVFQFRRARNQQEDIDDPAKRQRIANQRIANPEGDPRRRYQPRRNSLPDPVDRGDFEAERALRPEERQRVDPDFRAEVARRALEWNHGVEVDEAEGQIQILMDQFYDEFEDEFGDALDEHPHIYRPDPNNPNPPRGFHGRPPPVSDPDDDLRIPKVGTATQVPITLFSEDGFATHVLSLTLGNTNPAAVALDQEVHKRAAEKRKKHKLCHYSADEVVRIASENGTFTHFSGGPRGGIWVIKAGREDVLVALEEMGEFGGGKWQLLGAGIEGSEGMLFVIHPPRKTKVDESAGEGGGKGRVRNWYGYGPDGDTDDSDFEEFPFEERDWNPFAPVL